MSDLDEAVHVTGFTIITGLSGALALNIAARRNSCFGVVCAAAA